MVYGPCSLGVVSVLVAGTPGMSTEKRPSSEVYFSQTTSPGVAAGVGAGVGELLGAGLGGRLVCSCALNEKLRPSVISKTAKNVFIYGIILFSSLVVSQPADYTPRIDVDDTDLKAL